MKIEILLNPSTALLTPAPVIVPAFSGTAAAPAAGGRAARGSSGGSRGGRSGPRGRGRGRPGKKEARPQKTQEELDAEMAEYMNVDVCISW